MWPSAFWGILDITGATMGTLQIPDHLKELIDRQIAEGRSASEVDYVVEALRAYAEHIEAESEIASMVGRADTDMAAGRFVTVTGAEDSEALHARAMGRLHARMPGDTQEH
jgi:Arc/MetJ-type ribon-helix-helix transcriptional regulator